jgi:hypothetical protein
MERNYKVREDAIKSGYLERESKFNKLIKYLENIYKKYKYNKLVSKGVSEKPMVIPSAETIAKEKVNTVAVSNIIQTPVEKSKKAYTKPECQIIKNKLSAEHGEIKIIPYSKVQMQKIAVQNSVREFINKKLHASIVNEQEKIYTNKATKMRVRMLPEILASIKDTRADNRSLGIKPKVSNSDAVDLYTRINGKNKKLVNYMLKKRNSDGKRIFDVKSIIDALGSVHKKVIIERLKPAETKARYEEFYQEQLNTYGKLTRVKKNKSKK